MPTWKVQRQDRQDQPPASFMGQSKGSTVASEGGGRLGLRGGMGLMPRKKACIWNARSSVLFSIVSTAGHHNTTRENKPAADGKCDSGTNN